jgi:hypothetical protein
VSLLLLLRESAYAPGASVAKFTGAKDVSVRLQALDGFWEVCGSDHARGIIPENVELRSDQWGSSRATFDLRRNPKEFWPDIGAFTPVEIEVGGVAVWSGRVSETPVRDSTDSVISVQCEGWQAHLDDDLYERIYVHTNLTEWKDVRSDPGCDLTTYIAAGNVTSTDGVLVVGWTGGTPVPAYARAGAGLDLGPNSVGKRIIIDYTWTNGTGSAIQYLAVLSGFTGVGSSTSVQTVYNAIPGGASGTISQTLTTASRYIWIGVYNSGGAFTPTADLALRVTSVQVFADTAYESGNASVLKGDVVVKDALSRASVLLSADRTQIATGTFNIPEFAPSEPRTPRAVWEAVDAFEDRYKKITVDKVPVYKAKPTYPEVEVGAWSGMEFEDSAANSGDDVYSRVIVTGDQPNGTPLRITRSQSQQTGALYTAVSSPAFTNPGFETNTTGWTATTSTITRDTAVFDVGTASGRWDNTGASDNLGRYDTIAATLTGTFRAGVTYLIQWRMRASANTTSWLNVTLGTATDSTYTYAIDTPAGSFKTHQIAWTPTTTVTSGVALTLSHVILRFDVYYYIDECSVKTSTQTIVDRRGFQRTKQLSTSFMLTASAAKQIADKWLLSHKTTPFKGKAKLTGNDAIRDITSGRPVAPEQMLLRTGELIRFSDRIDPDTGAQGRDGKIVEASYKVDDNSVELTIDSSRAGFEALLNRLGVVLGQMR